MPDQCININSKLNIKYIVYFMFLYVFPPDTVSYRQRDRGSILIQYVVEVFNTYAHKDDIEELFRKVSFASAK